MKIPDEYFSWREKVGFSDSEIQLLYQNIDSVNENQLRVYLRSIHSKHYQSVGLASGAFQLASDRLINSGEVRRKVGFMLTIFNGDLLIRTLDVAMNGRYNEANILLRSLIESEMRLCFNVMKVYGPEYFDQFLENVSWKENDPKWENALRKEKALDLGAMARCLDRIGFSKPIRSLYHHFKINDLNSFTHSNILQIAESESNFLNDHGKLNYDEEKFAFACKLWKRYVEFMLISMQHILDKVAPNIEPILIPGKHYPSELFPNYSKLATSTKHRSIDF
ncbi:hypothetical protein OAO11_03315 [Candidatus Poseidoniaceae archaeon]|nr:hypothetical protein [Candidatus Poseidoniaceae archaeon]